MEAASIFHGMNKKIGDVRPLNILINEEGQTKIIHQYSFPNELSNYDKSLLEKEPTYLGISAPT